jgi:hypothetical protein
MSRDRQTPRISITKLAEYMVASPSRRRSILRDQRYPSAFIAAKFREAYAAISDVLVRGGDPRMIDAQIATWRSQTPTSTFNAECLALCIDALTAFKALMAKGAFQGLSFTNGITEAYLELGGVQLSARPEALIEGPEIGAVKIYLSKTVPLTKEEKNRPGSGSFAAAALHLWAEQHFGSARPDRCLVVDVFAGEVYVASAHNVKKRANLTAACEEIAAVWGAIKRPPGAPPVRPSAAGAP